MVLGSSFPLERKTFHYSGLKGQTKVGRNGLHYYSKKVTIVFASSDQELIKQICMSIFDFPSIFLGNLMLEPESVEQEIVQNNTGTSRYLCISPIVLSNINDPYKSKEFIHPSSERFSDLLYESTMERMEKSGLYTADDTAAFYKFQVIPDNGYLEKLSQRHKKFARIYLVEEGSQLKEIRGYTFPFSLYASEEVHDFIFQNGFGEFSSHGFGMIDYHDQSLVRRQVMDLPSSENSQR